MEIKTEKAVLKQSGPSGEMRWGLSSTTKRRRVSFSPGVPQTDTTMDWDVTCSKDLVGLRNSAEDVTWKA
ncbi:hypothetical protein CEXT_230401 [Caerostris extrusa]|uniref:Uncharacterized protein n=1 Tax=Caerostris extrusa TaxID=172846 RepID=A0AAV4U9I5_CAEEX|nr:hypothetical protein CEXT_230401 [Caerostris extrusa]